MSTTGRAAALHERLRYLGTFGEHLALAAGLRLLPTPSPPDSGYGPLRVVFLSPHPPMHLGTQVRFTRWMPHLERLGCSVEILTPSTDAQFADYERRSPGADTYYHHVSIHNQWRNLRRAATADVVVLHRGLFPFSTWQRPTFERQLARLNPRLVYDFYDAIWLQRQEASRQQSRIGRWLHPADKVEEIIRLSRVVTVSNEQLAQFARQYHDDVRLLPMLVEPEDYELRRHEQRSPVVLGWLGSRYNLPRLLSLAPALRRVAATRDIVVRIVSSEPVDIPGVPVESYTHPWSPASEREDLAGLDIGLLPLDVHAAHDRDKSPFKLLQYLAAGLAVVATPVAIDHSVLRPGECFLPATDEQEWVDALTRLVDDPARRAAMARTARQVVVDHYSFGRHAEQFLDALLAAAGRTRAPASEPVAPHG